MLTYANVHYPNRPRARVLDLETGLPVNGGTSSTGEIAFASIAKAIVDHGWSLDSDCIESLKALLDAS